ncbi:proteobacterial dedicated sortase system response regulator [Paraferrimonas sedimenticola]|nr:proteobacterial dedicated sortase system response regulator [Paraferrimonas sedimenticola]
MKRIAIVEDERAIRENYIDLLTHHGYSVQGFPNRLEAQQSFASQLPDLVIIDIGLQDEMDGGFSLCQWLRAKSSSLPIIFLTARDNDIDMVSGFRLGADDYLSKDVSVHQLVARLSALFRRADLAQTPQAPKLIEVGHLSIDPERLRLSWKGCALDLTVTEFWLIHALAQHPGHVRARSHLMQAAQMVVDDATITSHVKRIRKKFQAIDKEFDAIDTVYGAGYRWNEAN